MGCGAYHSVVSIGETQFAFKKYSLENMKLMLGCLLKVSQKTVKKKVSSSLVIAGGKGIGRRKNGVRVVERVLKKE